MPISARAVRLPKRIVPSGDFPLLFGEENVSPLASIRIVPGSRSRPIRLSVPAGSLTPFPCGGLSTRSGKLRRARLFARAKGEVGSDSAQTLAASEHRGWKRQPVGSRIGLGGSPSSAGASELPRHQPGNRRQERPRVGMRGSVNRRSVGPSPQCVQDT